jgi:hypothetical protein
MAKDEDQSLDQHTFDDDGDQRDLDAREHERLEKLRASIKQSVNA